ncbi:hypothetical protein M378DRAFT_16886 [Amanita muscaria Koide BX008]|uniref:Uncharacterized protein n=1 Tax=Amanita muscaria (strain Koide BX008) TaxID=946122 RepID=A0A0C2S1Z9_AMAMK|nr:hypothetical protein M378DRAFT_16886 [Amanita muscaria Koide BX008]
MALPPGRAGEGEGRGEGGNGGIGRHGEVERREGFGDKVEMGFLSGSQNEESGLDQGVNIPSTGASF